MKQTIYIDVLLAVNIFINYFLLLAAAKFLAVKRVRLRILAASILGAAYSLTMLMPSIPMVLALLMKLAMSASLVFVAFPWGGKKQFLKSLACFYIMNFAFAGFMMAIWYFISPQGMIIKNSIVYFNISPIILIGSTAVCYVVIRFIYRFIGKHEVSGGCCTVTVVWKEKTVECNAKIDTGNSLVEPFSHYPVIVMELEPLSGLFSEQLRTFFQEKKWEHPGNTMGSEEIPKIRMVPFQTISGVGVLPAFSPEKVIIKSAKKQIETQDVYIAVCQEKITSDGFKALLNPDLFSQGKEIVMGRKC